MTTPNRIAFEVVAAAALAICTACGVETGDRVYVTSGFTDEVLKIDARSGEVIGRVAVNPRAHETDEPHGIAVAPDGGHWYATASHGEPTLWKFELPSDRLVGRVRLDMPGASRIGISPDGRRAFIPDYYRDGMGAVSGMAVVELFDLTVTSRSPVCPAPHDAQTNPDGTLVAIACSLSDEIVVLDAATLDEAGRFFVDSAPGVAGQPAFKPLNLVWSRSGDVIFVSMHLAGLVGVFSPGGDVEGRIDVGAGPAQLALTPDGATLVTANRMDGSVSFVDVPELRERARVAIGGAHPHGVGVSTDGRHVFVTFEGSTESAGGVVAFDVMTATPVWEVEAGAFTLGVAYVPSR